MTELSTYSEDISPRNVSDESDVIYDGSYTEQDQPSGPDDSIIIAMGHYDALDAAPGCPRCSGPNYEYDVECKALVCDDCGLWIDDEPLDDWLL